MKPHRFVTKTLISAAAAVCAWVAGAVAAGADPNPDGAEPNPFGGLRCGCHQAGPGGPDAQDEIRRGLREGLSVRVPGLPPP
jgi:hypothetical protein